MRILILQGHPDRTAPHFCHALADAYAQGARSAGHEVDSVDIGMMDFAFLHSQSEWESGLLPPALAVGLRLLKRNILGLVGIAPVRDAVVGSVEGLADKQRTIWLGRLRSWDRAAV